MKKKQTLKCCSLKLETRNHFDPVKTVRTPQRLTFIGNWNLPGQSWKSVGHRNRRCAAALRTGDLERLGNCVSLGHKCKLCAVPSTPCSLSLLEADEHRSIAGKNRNIRTMENLADKILQLMQGPWALSHSLHTGKIKIWTEASLPCPIWAYNAHCQGQVPLRATAETCR